MIDHTNKYDEISLIAKKFGFIQSPNHKLGVFIKDHICVDLTNCEPTTLSVADNIVNQLHDNANNINTCHI